MDTEVIILAGGKGSRLQSLVSEVPKPMAPIHGKPFLEILLGRLAAQGFGRAVLSVGYKKEIIKDYFGYLHKNMQIGYAEEAKPLGTGGAIMLALQQCKTKNVLILNGDTFFEVNYDYFCTRAEGKGSPLAIAVKEMKDFDRYGTVAFGADGLISHFNEKMPCAKGFINAGAYWADKAFLQSLTLPDVFSFEENILQMLHQKHGFQAIPLQGFFVDIGVPEDYKRAQATLY